MKKSKCCLELILGIPANLYQSFLKPHFEVKFKRNLIMHWVNVLKDFEKNPVTYSVDYLISELEKDM